MFMEPELVNQLMFKFIHEHDCSGSDCGAASKNEVDRIWFDVVDVEGAEGVGGGNHVRRAVERMVTNLASLRLALRPNPKSILRDFSVQLTPTTAAVLAFQHGKLVFARPLIRTKLNDYMMGLKPKPINCKKHSEGGNLVLHKTSLDNSGLKLGWPFGLKGTSQPIQAADEKVGKFESKTKIESSAFSGHFCAGATAEKYASGLQFGPNVDVHKSALGWPLRKISIFINQETVHMAEPKTATRFPERSVSDISTNFKSEESSTDSNDSENIDELYCSSPIEKLWKEIQRVPTNKISDIILFNYKELQRATSDFSPGNMVGMGGSSRVYKGSLPSGKLVAVKTFRSYKEACEDFFTEIKITSSLSHKNIVPLAGVCLDQDRLMSVYDLLPQGSLEEHLHGYKRKPGLPWESRFKIAVAVAEALMYLHNECPRPVIHRDVTSSNILLSNDFHPQLSDFGLAMWRQTSENIHSVTRDVLGTFGYIAPEYFMHGKVSDKIDVYSYGVVLLELLSGRRPVNLKAQKGHESVVKWARRLIDYGEVSSLLDPKLGEKLNANQIHTVVLAAYFCTSQTAEHRPKMSQICKLLKGEISPKQLIISEQNHLNDSHNCSEEEELWGTHLSSSVLKIINNSLSTIRPGLKRRKTLSDCLQECDRRFTLSDLLTHEDD